MTKVGTGLDAPVAVIVKVLTLSLSLSLRSGHELDCDCVYCVFPGNVRYRVITGYAGIRLFMELSSMYTSVFLRFMSIKFIH